MVTGIQVYDRVCIQYINIIIGCMVLAAPSQYTPCGGVGERDEKRSCALSDKIQCQDSWVCFVVSSLFRISVWHSFNFHDRWPTVHQRKNVDCVERACGACSLSLGIQVCQAWARCWGGVPSGRLIDGRVTGGRFAYRVYLWVGWGHVRWYVCITASLFLPHLIWRRWTCWEAVPYHYFIHAVIPFPYYIPNSSFTSMFPLSHPLQTLWADNTMSQSPGHLQILQSTNQSSTGCS